MKITRTDLSLTLLYLTALDTYSKKERLEEENHKKQQNLLLLLHRAYNLHKRSSQEYVSQTISKKLATIFSQKQPVKEAGGNDVKKVIQK